MSITYFILFVFAIIVVFSIMLITALIIIKKSGMKNESQSREVKRYAEPRPIVQTSPNVQGMQFCPVCGEKRISGMNFCYSCGFDFSSRSNLVSAGRKSQPSPSVKQEMPNRVIYEQPNRRIDANRRFTPKRIISMVGLFFIILSGVLPWSANRNWNGIFNGGYQNVSEIGFQSTEGVIAVLFAVLGLIFIMSIHNEKFAYILSLGCTVMSVIATFIFKSNNFWGESDGYRGLWTNVSALGVGFYVVFLGAVIVLACLFIPSREE